MTEHGDRRPQTLLLGLDGATFRVLGPMMEAGVMPELTRVVRSGVACELYSTPHPFTPPAWTTLATGVGPGEHGIFDFVRVLRGSGRPSYTMATARDVRRETIWQVASRSGRRVACLNYPLSFPPRPIDGWVVPGFVPPRHLRRFVHPPELYDRLLRIDGFDPAELLLNLDIEREAIQTLDDDEYEAWIRLHIRREAQWAAITRLAVEEEHCDLVAVIFDGVDKLQHLCWRFLDPDSPTGADPEFEARVGALCTEYFASVDRHIANLIDAADDDANVVICSDHGFGPTGQIFYPNVLLERAGLLTWADGVGLDQDEKQQPEGHRNPTILFDWDRTSAYALTAGSNGIHIHLANEPDERGVAADDYDAVRARVEEIMLSYRDPRTGAAPVQRVMRREEVFPGEHSHLGPDLTLILSDYGFLSILRADEPVKPRSQVMGTHAPEGVFAATGPALRRAGGVPPAPFGIVQVAPLLLHLAGVALPSDLDADLPEAVLDSAWLDANPPEIGPPTELPDQFFDGSEPALGQAGERQVLDRLRALGYVE
jgi:predicted AlkP superfamily phosphohydrolase/phosphomutase